jgi:hypothetical protein
METTATTAPRAYRVVGEPAPAGRIPWHIYAVVFASTSVIVGVIWDISWHQSIGRDTFWSPPHLAIYLGGVVAGIACGWHVLHTSFAGPPEQRAAGVSFWKFFRGSFGAWVCIWGTLAMLTSAPFDDWWHNAYGLDVKILSPPHMVLAVGILAIQLGALLMVLALQNREERGNRKEESENNREEGQRSRISSAPPPLGSSAGWSYRILYVYTAGLVMLNFGIIMSEHTLRIFMHNSGFYQLTAAAFPLVLVAVARSSRLRWPATSTAAVYMGVTMLMMWVLQLFPAEPMLAPIRNDLSVMMPPWFPLLLIVPAVAIDLAMRRLDGRRSDWLLAPVLGALFLLTFLPAQWYFAEFLMTDHAKNWFFATHLLPYMVPPTFSIAQGEFILTDAGPGARALGLALALVFAVVSARAGLSVGRWMQGVQR